LEFALSRNEIFPIRGEHIDTIADIWLESSIDAHSFVPAAYWKSKVDEMKKIWLPSSQTWGLKTDGETVGFYSLVDCKLAAIFIKPAAQGQGFGRLLMEHAKSQRHKLELTVYEKNSKSTRFYEKCGFSRLSERIDAETGEKEVLMEFIQES
jgi:putative acetyltransferase